MKDYPYLYRGSLAEARRRNQIDLWQESLRENIRCKDAIEEAIRRDFDGMHMRFDCIEPMIRDFGFLRIAWVLANTLQQKNWDGRFSSQNRAWAAQFPVPKEDRVIQYIVESHPAVLNGFVSEYREVLQRSGLFGIEQCEADSFASQSCEAKVLVLSPDILRGGYWSRGNQLWLALEDLKDNAVRCICLWDDEITSWNRNQLIGVLKEEYLPDWAKEKPEQLRPSAQEPPAFVVKGGFI